MKPGKSLSIFSLLFLSIVLIFLACSGDDGSSGTSASGYWEGSIYSSVENEYYPIIGVVSEDNEAIFLANIDVQVYQLFAGTLNVSGNSVTGALTGYTKDILFQDGSTVGSVTFNGTVKTKKSIVGTFTGVGDSGIFALIYNSYLYERASSLGLLAGQWASDDTYIEIIANGSVTGGNTEGCVFNGSVSLIDPNFNTYRCNFTATSCADAGSYNGIVVLRDETGYNNSLGYGVYNPTNAFWGELFRQ
jgi:hypothetical protein